MKKRKIITLICLLLIFTTNLPALIGAAETTTSSEKTEVSSSKEPKAATESSSTVDSKKVTDSKEAIEETKISESSQTSESSETNEQSTNDSQKEEPEKDELQTPKPMAAKFLIEGTDIDAKFAEYLRTNPAVQSEGASWGGGGTIAKDGITDDMMAELEWIRFDLNFTGMDSLKGIEYATNLISLEAPQTYINSVDVSKNTKLEVLNLNRTNITSLDVSKNVKLKSLNCDWTSITSLDISNNKELETLDCSNGDITSFTLTEKLPNLKRVQMSGNPQLTSADFSGAENLERLEIFSCHSFVDLNITKLTKLKYLDCYGGRLPDLDISKNVELTYLKCSSNSIDGDFDVSNNTKLEILDCHDNGMGFTGLKATNNPVLKKIDCSGNNLGHNLDISGAPVLEELIANSTQLGSLDISSNKKLVVLKVQRNLLKTIDVTLQPDLVHLNCSENSIPSLELEKNKKLDFLDATFNKLSELDVSENKILKTLQCGNNDLTTLDLSVNPELITLSFPANKFRNLPSFTNNQKLEFLDFSANQIRDITNANGLPNLSYMAGSDQEFFVLVTEIIGGKYDFVLKTTNHSGLSAANHTLPGSPVFTPINDTVKLSNLEPDKISSNSSQFTFSYDPDQLTECTGYKSFSGKVTFLPASFLETSLVPEKTEVFTGERVKWTWTTKNITEQRATKLVPMITLPTGLVIDETTIKIDGVPFDITHIDGSRNYRNLYGKEELVITFETVANGSVGAELEAKGDVGWYDENTKENYDTTGKGTVKIKAPTQFNVNIEKLDFDDKTTPLQGVKFELFKDNGSGGWTSVGAKTTDQYGKVGYTALLAGKYKLVEVSTITGYQLGDDQIINIPADVPANQDTLNLKVYNKKKAKLPQTGGIGTAIYSVAGTLTVIVGLAFYQRKIGWGRS